MKRIFRSVFALLVVLTIAMTIPGTALAAGGTVTYDGNAQEFIFAPGSDLSPTDLFTELKNVMPGDSITEEIVIKNPAYRNVKIRVYMRSKGAQEGTDEFLSQLNLTVTQKDDSILFDGPADETGKLTDWTYIGTIYSGGKITLNVTLDVPITMGNEFQDQVGYIDWEFKIEERPVEVSDPTTPQTGDSFQLLIYGGVMILSMAALVVLVIANKRRSAR